MADSFIPDSFVPDEGVPDVRSTITYAGEEKPALERFGAAVEPYVGKSVTRAGGAFAEGIGLKMLFDMRGLFDPDPASRQRAQDAMRGFVEGIAAEPGRVMGELWESERAMLALNAVDTLHHLAKAVPLFGAIAAQVEDDVSKGDYAGAVGHTAAIFAPFAGPRAVRAGTEAAQRGATAARQGFETVRTVAPAAARGGWQSAREPVNLPLTIKGKRIPNTGIALPRAVVYGFGGAQTGGLFGIPALGAAGGVGAAILPGAVRGARAAYGDLLATRIARAQAEAAARVRPPTALPPGPIITPPPPPPESFVRGVPGQYAQPELVPPGRQLPPEPPPPIITPAPEDTSFVRGVAGAYPEAIPPGPLRENEAALAAARALREEMGLAEGELRPPPAEQGDVAGAVAEIAAREQKAARLAQAVRQWDIPSETVQTFEPEHWRALAQSIAEELPATPEAMESLKNAVVFQLRQAERGGPKPSVPPVTPPPKPPPTARPEAQAAGEALARELGQPGTPLAEPAPAAGVTASGRRVENLSQEVASWKLPMSEVEKFSLDTAAGQAARKQLEALAVKRGLRRPTRDEIPLIIERVRELREAPPKGTSRTGPSTPVNEWALAHPNLSNMAGLRLNRRRRALSMEVHNKDWPELSETQRQVIDLQLEDEIAKKNTLKRAREINASQATEAAERSGTPVAEATARFRKAKDAAKVEFAPAEPQGWGAILEQAQGNLNAEAEAAMERMRKRGSFSGTKLGANFPLDFNDVSDMAIWGASKIMNGTVNVRKWSREMLADAGPEAAARLKPLLPGIYEESQKVYERMLKSATEGLPSLQKTMEMYRKGKAGEDWYPKTRAELEDVFGQDAPIFLRFLAATSPNQTVSGNVTMALKAYHQWKHGEPFTGFLKTEHWSVAENLEKIVNGEEFGGVKQKSFEANIFGDPIPVTVDRWIYRAFGFPGSSPSPAQYKFIDYAISQAAKRKGIEPRQMQAAIWKTIKEELGKAGNTSEAFEVVLRKRLEADPILAAEIRRAAGK